MSRSQIANSNSSHSHCLMARSFARCHFLFTFIHLYFIVVLLCFLKKKSYLHFNIIYLFFAFLFSENNQNKSFFSISKFLLETYLEYDCLKSSELFDTSYIDLMLGCAQMSWASL